MANVIMSANIPAFRVLHRIYGLLDEVNADCAEEMKINFWIAGGCVSDLARGKRFNDIDVFSPRPQDLVEQLSNTHHKPYFEIPGSISNFRIGGCKVQVITGYQPQNEDACIDLFDFTAACGVYSHKQFVCHERFWQDNATRRLVINNLPKPLSTLDRMMKYCRKGFKHCPVGLSRVIKAISEEKIDWSNPSQNTIDFYPDGTPKFVGID